MEKPYQKIAFCLIVGCFLWSFVPFLHKVYLALSFNYILDYGEGSSVILLEIFKEYGHYYLGLSDYPFVHGVYPPFFYFVSSLFSKILLNDLLAMRLVSFLSTLGIVFMVYKVLRKVTDNVFLSLVFALFYLSVWFTQRWSLHGRIDNLAIFLSMISAYFFLFSDGLKVRSKLFFSALFLALAVFTRQTEVVVFAAIVLTLVSEKRKEGLFYFLCFFLGFCSVFLLYYEFLSGGNFLKHVLYYTSVSSYDEKKLLIGARRVLGAFNLLYFVIVFGLFLVRKELWKLKKYRIILFYWVFGSLSLLSYLRVGSSDNYYLHPFLANIFLLGIVCQELYNKKYKLMKHFPLLVCLTLFLNFYLPTSNYELAENLSSPKYHKMQEDLDKFINKTSGSVLLEDASLALRNGKKALIDPFGVYFLEKKGALSLKKIKEDCLKEKYQYVVGYSYFFFGIKGLLPCLKKSYQFLGRVGKYRVYGSRAVASTL